jgi:hypothetical protein
MTRDELLKQLAENRKQLSDLIEGVPAEELVKPGAYGEWSVKDVLVHISHWESEVIIVLFQAAQGAKPESEVFNPEYLKVNEVWYQENKDRELDRVLDDFHAVRNQLLRRLKTYPEKDLTDSSRYSWMKGQALLTLVKEIVLDHEAEHLQGLQPWRASLAA